jgi:hypothetical protein
MCRGLAVAAKPIIFGSRPLRAVVQRGKSPRASDPRFEAFAELDIGTHSGRKLE